jgi:hypothetical protein
MSKKWQDDSEYESKARKRFMAFLPDRIKDECWEWSGNLGHGYGIFLYRGKSFRAHRLAITFLAHKEIPADKIVMHLCHNKLCCNPSHLQIGTEHENITMDYRDGKRDARGEGNGRSKLGKKDILKIRKLYDTGKATITELALKYSVNDSYVSKVCKRKRWAHV